MNEKMRDLIGLISPRWRGAQKCEACGEDFVCGAALTGCWCTEIKLSAEVRAKLREKYQHCLCRQCLEKEVVSE
jgi:hypothetical protein